MRLKLDPDTRTPAEIAINKARIEGMHDAIKEVIKQIEMIEHRQQAIGYSIAPEFIRLRDE
jgi:hypothetical protein